jgi:hypothetical protein
MFREVATVLQQIMTHLNGAESEADRIVAITKIVLKLMRQNGCILWHADPLVRNDRKISSYTITTAR